MRFSRRVKEGKIFSSNWMSFITGYTWRGVRDGDQDSQDARLNVAEQWRELSHSILDRNYAPELCAQSMRA